jgi:branched-chain amino acid transport system permease protein
MNRTDAETVVDRGVGGLNTVVGRVRTLGRGVPGRPELYTSYEEDQAIFNTPAKRIAFVALLAVLVYLPFTLTAEMNMRFAVVFAAAIGAIGMNIISGYAGQISLGHAFFIGLGAYTGAVISGDPEGRSLGFGIENMLVWLPAAGIVPAIAGFVVAPVAVRVRGLYLAIVTLGLVFIGEHLFRELRFITGGAGVGRQGPRPTLFGFRFDQTGEVLGVLLTSHQRLYFLCLILLLVFGLLAKNLVRSGLGRAFAAVRDRDIAAEVMGVSLLREKTVAFTISSFYAGIAGGLLFAVFGYIEPASFDLFMSIRYIAMILIGGVATISGSILGAAFVELIPRATDVVAQAVPFITLQPRIRPGVLLTRFQVEAILYGLFIIGFIILEPRGLYGLWVRIRNYFKAFPFSY